MPEDFKATVVRTLGFFGTAQAAAYEIVTRPSRGASRRLAGPFTTIDDLFDALGAAPYRGWLNGTVNVLNSRGERVVPVSVREARNALIPIRLGALDWTFPAHVGRRSEGLAL